MILIISIIPVFFLERFLTSDTEAKGQNCFSYSITRHYVH